MGSRPRVELTRKNKRYYRSQLAQRLVHRSLGEGGSLGEVGFSTSLASGNGKQRSLAQSYAKVRQGDASEKLSQILSVPLRTFARGCL